MSDSPEINWPQFAGAYVDAFGEIDADIFEAGRSLWPRAARCAARLVFDQMAAQTVLLKACAKVTAARARGSEVDSLPSYLFRSYKHELFAQLRMRGRHEVLETERAKLSGRSSGLTLDEKILIEEIMTSMRPSARQIFEGLILGYTYEELAKRLGKQSNVLRSAFSKELARIRKELGEDQAG